MCAAGSNTAEPRKRSAGWPARSKVMSFAAAVRKRWQSRAKCFGAEGLSLPRFRGQVSRCASTIANVDAAWMVQAVVLQS